ncbi:MAG TPA: membrane dipeptidase [Cyclobacteriaceae bacterium]|nr:membrane dipeptidase [Cyclobacteriaceae bacterium]
MFSIDAHLDLSMNAMEWNRDLRMSVEEIRDREKGLTDKPDRGKNTVSFSELRKGDFGLVVATQIARYVERGSWLPGWNSPEQAWAQTQAQIAWYQSMEEDGEMKQITDLASLEKHIADWNSNPSPKKAIGYILSLEGADSIVTIGHLEKAYRYGLRALGPAHYGPGRYAFGTDSNGPMGQKGKALLKEMERLNIILDATHLCDESFREALDTFNGHVWASHHNCRALVNHNRQFSDEQLKELIGRGAVIGAPMDAWMIVPGWIRGQSTPEGMGVNLERVVDHMDHICQLAGNAEHIGIGSDLDGAFGKEQSPSDIETIADLQKLRGILASRGYKPEEIENVMQGNWLRFLRKAWRK